MFVRVNPALPVLFLAPKQIFIVIVLTLKKQNVSTSNVKLRSGAGLIVASPTP